MNFGQMRQMHGTNLYRAALIKSLKKKYMENHHKQTLNVSTNWDISKLKVSLIKVSLTNYVCLLLLVFFPFAFYLANHLLNNKQQDNDENNKKTASLLLYIPQNYCSSSPCPGNQKCQTGFTSKGYRCTETSSGEEIDHNGNFVLKLIHYGNRSLTLHFVLASETICYGACINWQQLSFSYKFAFWRRPIAEGWTIRNFLSGIKTLIIIIHERSRNVFQLSRFTDSFVLVAVFLSFVLLVSLPLKI